MAGDDPLFARRALPQNNQIVSVHANDRWCDESACIDATSSLERWLNRICRAFYDRATLDYPWSPEDNVTWWDMYDVGGRDDGIPEFD